MSGRGWGTLRKLPSTPSPGLRHQLPACSLLRYCLYFDPHLREHKSWWSNSNALSTNSRHSFHYTGFLLSFYVKHCGSTPKILSWLFQRGFCHFSPIISPPTPPVSLSHIGSFCSSQETENGAWTRKMQGEVRSTFLIGSSSTSHIPEGP